MKLSNHSLNSIREESKVISTHKLLPGTNPIKIQLLTKVHKSSKDQVFKNWNVAKYLWYSRVKKATYI